MKNLKPVSSFFGSKMEFIMSFLTKNEDQYVLLDSSIDYLNATAYLSLVFLNGDKLTLKCSHLLSVGYTFIDYLKDSQSISYDEVIYVLLSDIQGAKTMGLLNGFTTDSGVYSNLWKERRSK